MAMHTGEYIRPQRRTAPAHGARRADASYAAYARKRPAPLDMVESLLRRVDYLVWRRGRRGGSARR